MTLIDERVPQRHDDDPTPLVCVCRHPRLEPLDGLFAGAVCCTTCHRPRASDLQTWLTRPGGPRG